ncbi:MAG: hypothetical protein KGL39_28775, partial [Patescibacteria group bacterium]|nr:hypothetical protein [Patescibacteria group bacterium]
SLINFAHRQVALHRGYAGLFHDLTQGSALSGGPVRNSFLQLASTAKHVMLLFDTYHLGRLAFWNAVTRMGLPTSRRGVTLLDTSPGEMELMARNGEIPEELAQRLLEEKRKLDVLLQHGLNVGSVSDNLHAEWVQKLPVTGRFNRWLFEQYQRGAMSEVALIELERQRNAHPELSESQAARMVAKAVNTRFGNLGSQGWIKSKTIQDLARLCFLAPQWNESLIRAEVGAVRDAAGAVGDAPKGKLRMGTLGRTVGMAVLGQFLANQLINYFFRGKPTWENAEEDPGAKISAHIPDAIGKGPGFFLNPLGIAAEVTHLLWAKTARNGGDFSQALSQYAMGRLSGLSKAGAALVWRRDAMGRPLRTGKDVALEVAQDIFAMPLSGSAIYRAGKQTVTGEHEEAFPGQFQKQLMQTFGIKTDQAPSAEQRIRRLATEFKRKLPGYVPNPDYAGGVYDGLKQALYRGNMRDAAAELEDLRNKVPERNILRYMRSFDHHPFVGSRVKEAQFKKGLSEEQLQTYDRAREEQKTVKGRFEELLKQHPLEEPAEAAAAQ